MDVLDFTAMHVGQHITLPDGDGECVDLVNAWLLASGRPRLWSNAIDLPKAGEAAGMLWVANGIWNHPSAGDVVVWGPYPPESIGADGHCAVCLVARRMHLVSLDQNWPPGSPVRVQLHDYPGCLGWLVASG